MAMARILPQSASRVSLQLPRALIGHHRHQSNKTRGAQLIEVDLDAASSSPHDSADVVTVEINRLADAIQGIIVRRAAPDWLPFLPGFSYWVPRRPSAMRNHRAASLIQVIGELDSSGQSSNLQVTTELSEEQQMSLISSKGWPSSIFFMEGNIYPIPVVEVEPTARDKEDDASTNPEDV